MAQPADGGTPLERAGSRPDRRTVLRTGAIATAVAWTAPQIVSVPAAAAQSVMAPTFVGGSTASVGDFFANVSPGLPANVQVGDYMIAIVAVNENNGGITAPAGWTPYGNDFFTAADFGFQPRNVRAYLYTKAYAGEPGPYTFTRGNAFITQSFRVTIVAYRDTAGIETARFSAGDPPTIQNSLVANHTFPSITTIDSNRRIVRIGWSGQWSGSAQTWGAVAGATTVFDDNVGNVGSRGIVVGDVEQVAAGPTGTATASTNQANRSITTTLALAPA